MISENFFISRKIWICPEKFSDSQERYFQDDISTTSTSGSESLMTTDNESEEEMDPWIPLIEEAKHRSNIAFEEMKESLINSGLD